MARRTADDQPAKCPHAGSLRVLLRKSTHRRDFQRCSVSRWAERASPAGPLRLAPGLRLADHRADRTGNRPLHSRRQAFAHLEALAGDADDDGLRRAPVEASRRRAAGPGGSASARAGSVRPRERRPRTAPAPAFRRVARRRRRRPTAWLTGSASSGVSWWAWRRRSSGSDGRGCSLRSPSTTCHATPSSSRRGFPQAITSTASGTSCTALTSAGLRPAADLASSAARHGVEHRAVGRAQLDLERHLAEACVEQDRHGSKARIPASTRFSMPSAASVPSRSAWRSAGPLWFIARLFWPVAMIRLAQLISPPCFDLVVVEQRAARSLAAADALVAVAARMGA